MHTVLSTWKVTFSFSSIPQSTTWGNVRRHWRLQNWQSCWNGSPEYDIVAHVCLFCSFFFLFLPLFISLLLLLIFLLFLLFFSGCQKNQHYELNTVTLQSLFYVPILWHTLQYIRVSFPLWYFSVCFICDKVFIGIISFYNSSVKF